MNKKFAAIGATNDVAHEHQLKLHEQENKTQI